MLPGETNYMRKRKKWKRNTRNRVRRSNILSEVPEGEVREMGKKIMAENLNLQVSEAQ